MTVCLADELRRRACELARVLPELPTPCLLADAGAVGSNIRAGARAADELGAWLRPHAKAHKCSSLMRLQLEGGSASGVTCATAEEALALAVRGFRDVLVANEVVSRRGVDQLSGAARLLDRLSVAIDSRAGLEVAERVAAATGRDVSVLIDLDVGAERCGLPPASDAVVELARAVQAASGVEFGGLMGYASQANRKSVEDRARVARDVRSALEATRRRLVQLGMTVAAVSGGSTGMWNVDQGLTEVQLGSYVLMEGSYAKAIESPFVPALFCAATVISRPVDDRVVVNAGWKAISGELGLPLAPTGLQPVAFSDEHLVCRVTDKAFAPAIGQHILLLPAHLDPTINLHPRLYVTDAATVVDEWPVDLRAPA